MGIGWCLAHYVGPYGLGTMGALLGRMAGSIVLAALMRQVLSATLDRARMDIANREISGGKESGNKLESSSRSGFDADSPAS